MVRVVKVLGEMLRLEPVFSDAIQLRSSRDDPDSSLSVNKMVNAGIALVGHSK